MAAEHDEGIAAVARSIRDVTDADKLTRKMADQFLKAFDRAKKAEAALREARPFVYRAMYPARRPHDQDKADAEVFWPKLVALVGRWEPAKADE